MLPHSAESSRYCEQKFVTTDLCIFHPVFLPLKVAVTLLEAFYSIYSAKKKDDKEKNTIPRCSECNSKARYLYFIPPERLLSAGFI